MKRENLSNDVSGGGYDKDFVRDELSNFEYKPCSDFTIRNKISAYIGKSILSLVYTLILLLIFYIILNIGSPTGTIIWMFVQIGYAILSLIIIVSIGEYLKELLYVKSKTEGVHYRKLDIIKVIDNDESIKHDEDSVLAVSSLNTDEKEDSFFMPRHFTYEGHSVYIVLCNSYVYIVKV